MTVINLTENTKRGIVSTGSDLYLFLNNFIEIQTKTWQEHDKKVLV
jgi:hypothetical protein